MAVTITSMATSPATSKAIIDTNFSNVKSAVETLQGAGTTVGTHYLSSGGLDYSAPYTSTITKPPALSNWTVNQNGGSSLLTGADLSSGAIRLKYSGGSDAYLHSLKRNITVSGNFRFTVGLFGRMRQSAYCRVGVYVRNTTSGKIAGCFHTTGDGVQTGRQRWDHFSSFNTYDSGTSEFDPGPVFFLQVERSGTALYYRIGLQPDDLHQLSTDAVSDWVVTPGEVGVAMYCASGSGINHLWQVIHWQEENNI
jgi:hypothetical protein